MSLGDFSGVSAVENQLGSGERVLWKGRPRPGIRLRGNDAILIPFSLLWCGFVVFWEYMALFQIPKNNPAGWLFPLIGIAFVLFGLYAVVGRFFLDAKMRETTEYAITNRRAIIVTNLFGKKIRSINLQTAPDISLTEKGDGSGTITFGSAPYYGFWAQRNPWFPGAGSLPVFEMIDNVRSVYDMIESAKRD